MSFTGGEYPVFEYEWDSTAIALAELREDASRNVTEIYVPSIWYLKGWKVERSDSACTIEERPDLQRLYIKVMTSRRCFVRIVPVESN
jgi:hypothetical protein